VICGLVTQVMRKMTKTGNPWAIVTVEDLEGSIDVLFFPSDYQLASTLLVEDTLVTVNGRLDKSKDEPELRGRTVSAPNVAGRGVGGPVVIMLPSTRCTPPVVDRLKEVLRTHPGTTEVQLKLVTRNGTQRMRLDDRLRVTADPALYGDLKHLLGPGCLG
jgi:DNA polymerase-3 subunit alpha